MLEKPITFDRFVRILFAVAAVLAAFFIIDTLSGALLPFCIASLFAYLLFPIVRFIQYRMKVRSRALSIGITLILVLAVLFGVYELVVPPMIQELGKVKILVAQYLSGSSRVTSLPEAINRFITHNIDFHQLEHYLSEESLANLTRNILPRFWAFITQSMDLLFNILASLIILLYIFFILLDYETLSVGWVKFLPSRHYDTANRLVNDVKMAMNRYFRGQALIALCVAILTCIGFFIIDLPMAIAMGLFTGALTLVPYLKVVALIPTILLTFLKSATTGESFWLLLIFLITVFAVIQLIEDTLLVPRIMGKITGLNPAIILLSLSVWGSLLGIIGMIIALPATSLILSYYRRYRIHKDETYQWREKKKPKPKPRR